MIRRRWTRPAVPRLEAALHYVRPEFGFVATRDHAVASVFPLRCALQDFCSCTWGNTLFLPSGIENPRIGDSCQPYRSRVHGLMPATPEVLYGVGRHRHVHQEPHPLNSMTSSSAKLAA